MRNIDELMNKCVDEHIETFTGDKNTEELRNEVKIKLPQDEEQYKLVEVVGTHQKFKAYCEKNNETFRTYTANKNSTYYRCKRKTRYQGTKDVDNCLQKQPSKRMQNTIILSPW